MYCLRNRDSPGITANPPKKSVTFFVCFLSVQGGGHPPVNRPAYAGGTKTRDDFTHTVIHMDAL